MTASLFKITPTPPTSIKLEPGKDGTFWFTIESLAAPDKVIDILLQAQRIGDDQNGQDVDWLVAAPRTLRMPGGKTETVTITARPIASTPRGGHNVKLIIADKDRPNDSYAESPSVACEVVAPAVTLPPPRTKFPLWLILAIAGGVALIGGGVLAFFLLRGDSAPPGLNETCATSGTACEQGLVCAASTKKCLLPAGATCTQAKAAECASAECSATLSLCTVPHGTTCDPGSKDTVPCPANTTCDPAARLCLGHVGAACKVGSDCETGECTANVCAIKVPALQAGDPCETTCPAPLTCGASTHRCVAANGTPCTNHNQCSSTLCDAGVCRDPQVGRDCTADSICGLDQKCTQLQTNLKRCTWMPGHSCTGNGECTSQWCNDGTCSRDDGKCDLPRDCPAPFLCFTSKHRCLLPNGNQCGGHIQCDSTFCNPITNRCAPSPCPPCPPRTYCNNDPINPQCQRLGILLPPTGPIFHHRLAPGTQPVHR
jgi:hypothetical protein